MVVFTQIPKGIDRGGLADRYLAYAPLLSRSAQLVFVDSVLGIGEKLSLPHMPVHIVIKGFIVLHVLLEHIRKPAIIAPAHFLDVGVIGLVDYEPLVGGVGFLAGIEAHPYL